MEQLIIKQLELEDIISKIDFDIIICSSGYESRASFLAKTLSSKGIKLKFVLSFIDQKDAPNRKSNDDLFSKFGYSVIENGKDSTEFINKILPAIYLLSSNESVNVLVDYSSMTRTWFSAFVNSFQYLSTNVRIFFSYTVSKFAKPIPFISPSIKFDPIPGFNNLTIPDKPTALIIGLGYEKDRAAGLIEYFDAEEVFLFLTDNSEYKDFIMDANDNLIKQVKPDNIIPYPMYDIVYTYTILSNLCRELADDYRIIIAPCGPKPFSILSFICGIQLGFVDIWRIGGINDPYKENRLPSGRTIIFSLEKPNKLNR